jgi:hypothetical protein
MNYERSNNQTEVEYFPIERKDHNSTAAFQPFHRVVFAGGKQEEEDSKESELSLGQEVLPVRPDLPGPVDGFSRNAQGELTKAGKLAKEQTDIILTKIAALRAPGRAWATTDDCMAIKQKRNTRWNGDYTCFEMQCVCCGVWQSKTPEFFQMTRKDNFETTLPNKITFRNSASHGCHKCHRKPVSKVFPTNILKENNKFIDRLIKSYPRLNRAWTQQFKRNGCYYGHFTKVKLATDRYADFEMAIYRMDRNRPFIPANCYLDIIELTAHVSNGENINQIKYAHQWEYLIKELVIALRDPYFRSMYEARQDVHAAYAPSPTSRKEQGEPWVIALLASQVNNNIDDDFDNGYLPQKHRAYDATNRLVYLAANQLVDVQRMICNVSRLPMNRYFFTQDMFALVPDNIRYFHDNDGDPQLCATFVRRFFRTAPVIEQVWTRKKLLQAFVQYPYAPDGAIQLAKDELYSL